LIFSFLICFQRGLWVRALSIASPDSIFRIIKIAEELKITDIYLQVVIGGSSYYKSDILPRSQYLANNAPSDYSPLDSILKYTKDKGIRVHAWINTFLSWSLDSIPDSTRHIYHKHPEWFIRDISRRSMRDYQSVEWVDLGIEGLYIDPANEGVRQYLKEICTELIKKYSISGLHFDFIRYPGTYWGISDTIVAGLLCGLGVRDLRWLTLLRYPKLGLFDRWIIYNFYKENKKRGEAIKKFLEEIKKEIKGFKKDCIISCAVFPSPSRASYQYGQNWWEWKGLIDYPVVMSYTTDINLFKDFLNFALYNFSEPVMGIGFLWKGMELVANTEVRIARDANAGGICYFDFASLDTMADLNILKDRAKVLHESLLEEKLIVKNDSDKYFSELPELEWVEKGNEYIRFGEELDFARFLLQLSFDPDGDINQMGLDRQGFIKMIKSDVAGFEYLNRILLSNPKEFIEPQYREIEYTFIRWDADSTITRDSAKVIKKLDKKRRVYPSVLDPLAKVVFETGMNERKTIETKAGIYVFEVKRIKDSKRILKKKDIRPGLFPIYLYWTIKKGFEQIYSKERCKDEGHK